MPLVLEKKRTTFKIVVNSGKEDQVIFICKELSKRELMGIMDKNTTYEWDSPDDATKSERFSSLDRLGMLDDKIDHIIVDWQGLIDSEGNEIPCNRENKIKVDQVMPELIDRVLTKVDERSLAVRKVKEEKLKN